MITELAKRAIFGRFGRIPLRLTRMTVEVSSTARVNPFRIVSRPKCLLRIGEMSMCNAEIRFDRDWAKVSIGKRTFVGHSLIVSATEVEIGDDVLISWGCTIVDHNSHSLDWRLRDRDVGLWYKGEKDWTDVRCAQVRIRNRAWLGFGVAVMPGVEVGEGTVVAARSVVTKSLPPYVLAAGVPARIVRELKR